MALCRSGAPSMRRAEGAGGRRAVTPTAAATAAKKKIDSKAAWREFRELVWVHRRRLSIGLTLMMISRLAGIVLPALSKYVIDDVIGKGRHELLRADRAGGRRRHHRAGVHQLRPVADSRRRRAARDHRHAQARPGQDHAPAGALFRLHAEWRAAVADHERRRRHPQSRRHRPRAAGRRRRHRDHQPRRAAVSELAHDDRHRDRARPCSAAAWPTRSSGCGRCSASAARSRRR